MTASIPGIVSSIAMIIATSRFMQFILDLVFTNYPDLVSTVEVMEGLDRSNHNSVAFTLSLPPKRAKCKKIFLYSKADLESLRTTLANVPWSILMPANESIHTSSEKDKRRPNDSWITPEILRFVRKKRQAPVEEG